MYDLWLSANANVYGKSNRSLSCYNDVVVLSRSMKSGDSVEGAESSKSRPLVNTYRKLMKLPRLRGVIKSLEQDPFLKLNRFENVRNKEDVAAWSIRVIPENGLPGGIAGGRLARETHVRLDKEIASCIVSDATKRGIENLEYMYPVRANGGRGDYSLLYWAFKRDVYYRIFTIRDYILLLRSCLEDPPGRYLESRWQKDTGLHLGDPMRARERAVLMYLGKQILGETARDLKPKLFILDWWHKPYRLWTYLKSQWEDISPKLRGGPYDLPSHKTVQLWCDRWLLIAQGRLVTSDQGFLGDFRNPKPFLAVKQDGVELDLTDPRWYEVRAFEPVVHRASDRHPWDSGIEAGRGVWELMQELIKLKPALAQAAPK